MKEVTNSNISKSIPTLKVISCPNETVSLQVVKYVVEQFPEAFHLLPTVALAVNNKV
jgi:hypothetical protein